MTLNFILASFLDTVKKLLIKFFNAIHCFKSYFIYALR